MKAEEIYAQYGDKYVRQDRDACIICQELGLTRCQWEWIKIKQHKLLKTIEKYFPWQEQYIWYDLDKLKIMKKYFGNVVAGQILTKDLVLTQFKITEEELSFFISKGRLYGICQWCGKHYYLDYIEEILPRILKTREQLKREQIKQSKNKRRRVYFLYCQEAGLVKIGKTINIDRRVETLRFMNATGLDLIGIAMDEQNMREKHIHKKWESLRHHGEWFVASPELMSWIDEVKIKDLHD